MSVPARFGTLTAILALALVVAACPRGDRPGGRERPLETVDVEAPPDAGFDLEEDVKEERRKVALAGLLPGGFPADLPRYAPSSVVDFGEAVEGREYVELHTADAFAKAGDRFDAQLTAAGWRRAGSSAWEKGGRRVTIRLRSLDPGTAIVIEYVPE